MFRFATLDLLACIGHLGVAAVVLLNGSASPLALLTGLLAFDMFTWNFADFCYERSGRIEWHWLDLSVSPFTPALATHVILRFVGKARACSWLIYAFYAVFGSLALVGALAFVLPTARLWVDAPPWSAIFLTAEGLTAAFGLVMLVRHVRTARDDERARTQVLIAATIIGMTGGASDLMDDVGLFVPSFSNFATLLMISLVALITVRFRFLDSPVSIRRASVAVGVALAVIALYVTVFHSLEQRLAILLFATVSVTIVVVLAVRRALVRHSTHRTRLENLATLGRLSAQMAHDLKNPLAALKGSIQYLTEEAARNATPLKDNPFLDLISQQVDRIHVVVDDYQRLWRVQPQKVALDLNRSVRGLLAMSRFSAPGVEVRLDLDEQLPACPLDPDLIERVFDNLARNAMDAMPSGGVITVRTATKGSPASPRAVVVSFEDTGCGMDARVLERAFDEFFTTKSAGSGLGLSLVKRVVQAHGGRVHLASAPGRGTQIQLQFPVRMEAREGLS